MSHGRTSLLHPDRRQHIVDQIFDVLKDWRSSPFENEGPCVAGLRSALCMESQKWELANIEAQAIVGEALRLVGAERPTWEEGQRAYVGGADYCAWCGVEIPDDVRNQKGSYNFCSEVCAKRSRIFNEDQHSDQKDRIGDQAYRVISRARAESIICKGCGKPFHPSQGCKDPKYCSHPPLRILRQGLLCGIGHGKILQRNPCGSIGRC